MKRGEFSGQRFQGIQHKAQFYPLECGNLLPDISSTALGRFSLHCWVDYCVGGSVCLEAMLSTVVPSWKAIRKQPPQPHDATPGVPLRESRLPVDPRCEVSVCLRSPSGPTIGSPMCGRPGRPRPSQFEGAHSGSPIPSASLY